MRFLIGALFGLALCAATTQVEARSCDNIFVVDPPPVASGEGAGGEFYLYVERNPNTERHPVKGYLPAGTPVRKLSEQPIEGLLHYEFVSRYGESGYIRDGAVKRVRTYIEDAGLDFTCDPTLYFVVPIGSLDGEEVELIRLDEQVPMPTSPFSRSKPRVVIVDPHDTVERRWSVEQQTHVGNFIRAQTNLGYSADLYLRELDKGKTYRLEPIYWEPVKPITANPAGSLFARVFPGWRNGCEYQVKITEATINLFGLGSVKVEPAGSSQGLYNVYIRKQPVELKNFGIGDWRAESVFACESIVSEFTDHFRASIMLKIENLGRDRKGPYFFKFYSSRLRRGFSSHFVPLDSPVSWAPNSTIPEKGMLAFKPGETDFFVRYRALERYLAEQLDNTVKLEPDQRQVFIRFLLRKIVFAQSKKFQNFD